MSLNLITVMMSNYEAYMHTKGLNILTRVRLAHGPTGARAQVHTGFK